jgi:hypothetical protein
MKITEESTEETSEMLDEYHFDYNKAKPNRFATDQARITVILDPDVAQVFKTSESVNKVLRAILAALPHSSL